MEIRFAKKQDIDDILRLLKQVNRIHHEARPDILNFATKYTRDELVGILADTNRPVLVAVEDNHVLGYVFGIYKEVKGHHILIDEKSLYIDDICVDENVRGKRVGQSLYEASKQLARDNGCRRITLNVWAFNDSAKSFYEKMGMTTFHTTMEDIL